MVVPTARVPDLDGSRTVKVGVRPEKIGIATGTLDAPSGHNALRGQVRVSSFTGVGNQYIVETSVGVDVTVYAQNIGQQSAPRSGDEVTLTWPVEHTFIVKPLPQSVALEETEGD